jgi:hypothetical protein
MSKQKRRSFHQPVVFFVLLAWVHYIEESKRGSLCMKCQQQFAICTIDYYEDGEFVLGRFAAGKTFQEVNHLSFQRALDEQKQGKYKVYSKADICFDCLCFWENMFLGRERGAESFLVPIILSEGRLSCVFMSRIDDEKRHKSTPAIVRTNVSTVAEVLQQLKKGSSIQ